MSQTFTSTRILYGHTKPYQITSFFNISLEILSPLVLLHDLNCFILATTSICTKFTYLAHLCHPLGILQGQSILYNYYIFIKLEQWTFKTDSLATTVKILNDETKTWHIKIVYFKWYSETCNYVQIFKLWSLRLHGDCLHKIRLLGQSCQSWFHWSLIIQSTGWQREGCNPWRHQHPERQAFLHKKLIKDSLGYHVKFVGFESINSGERTEQIQLLLWKGHYAALKIWRQVPTTGAFPCQSYLLCFILHTTGLVRGRKKQQNNNKNTTVFMLMLNLQFRH